MKEKNGITLIALVITIIVLLILAGVALATLTGQGNIISNAENAVGKYNDSVASEQQFLNEIEKYFQNYLEGENVEEDKGVPVDKTEIANNPEDHFGGYVDYTAPNGDPEVKWRIFYTDEENVYLIADDLLPLGSDEPPFGKYSVALGWSENKITDPRITRWLKYIQEYPDVENVDAKTISWLLDPNEWKDYANSDYAEYAVGAPTLDLYSASYNKLHTDRQINFDVGDETGYNLKWSTDSNYSTEGVPFTVLTGLDISNDVYTQKRGGMWLASPGCYLAGEYLVVVAGEEIFFHESSSLVYGLRPIVCLKSEVQLNKKSDGTYTLSLPE